MVALLGPRQCGKTTLARKLAEALAPAAFFDLENRIDLNKLANPMMVLGSLQGYVILDEIQLRPELFADLRVLADRDPLPARFLILGSASPDIIRGCSESLAGRVEFVFMSGFALSETLPESWPSLWWRGGSPPAFLAGSDADARAWQDNFIRTFLERDLRNMGINIAPVALHRLWQMHAHSHAQIFKASELGRSLGESYMTIKRHTDILAGSFLLRQLPPWYENIGKRQVKSPKLYVRDSGLLHALLQIQDRDALSGHPKVGASWEGFALEQVLRLTGDQNAYFWATQSGAELDLFLLHKGRRLGIEFKFSETPRTTRSMREAIKSLNLERLFIVHPGPESHPLDDNILALSIKDIGRIIEPI
ncbi:MAG: ATP-binding protein [Proteobacteria bacterium]|nr:ATP-binding protein [Pseudomonadota bacterium]